MTWNFVYGNKIMQESYIWYITLAEVLLELFPFPTMQYRDGSRQVTHVFRGTPSYFM